LFYALARRWCFRTDAFTRGDCVLKAASEGIGFSPRQDSAGIRFDDIEGTLRVAFWSQPLFEFF